MKLKILLLLVDGAFSSYAQKGLNDGYIQNGQVQLISGEKQIIEKHYYTFWEMIARHDHQPSGKWAGPHNRSYSTLVKPSFYAILKEGSN